MLSADDPVTENWGITLAWESWSGMEAQELGLAGTDRPDALTLCQTPKPKIAFKTSDRSADNRRIICETLKDPAGLFYMGFLTVVFFKIYKSVFIVYIE